MKRSIVLYVVMTLVIAALAVPTAVFAAPKVTFFWALYDGLTEDYRAALESAFNKSNSGSEVQIVPVDWNLMQNKITTALAGGQPAGDLGHWHPVAAGLHGHRFGL
jgi:ABC-type glycerol-3-phosphate transport system substrate-binding protein